MKLKDVNLTAQELKDIAEKYVYYSYRNYDVVMEDCDEKHLYDADGKQYLDFFAGVAVMSCGYRNKRVNDAIREQIEQITQTCSYYYSVPTVMLAKKLCDAIGMSRIIYQNSGAEANEAMIKLARKYGTNNYGPNKYEIITALRSFHGRTFGAMTATGQPGSKIHNGFGDLVPGFKYAEYNNLESFREAITENTIAIMVEPVQAEGGLYPGKEEFIKGLRELCDEKGLLLLFDEVQTGLGRTGYMMGYMGYGVKPDIVTLAKAIGNGVPLGACCFGEKLEGTFVSGDGAHGTTYSNNALACAAGYAAVSEIIDRDLPGNAKKVGAYFMDKLQNLPNIKEIRGRGLLIGVELTKPVAEKVKLAACKNGLLVCNLGDSIVRMVPPLIIDEADCDKAYEILEKSINEVYADI